MFLSNLFPNKSWNVAFGKKVKSRLWAKATDAVQGLVNTVALVCLPLLRSAPFQMEKSDNWSLPIWKAFSGFCFKYVMRLVFSSVLQTFIKTCSMLSIEFSTWDKKDMSFAIQTIDRTRDLTVVITDMMCFKKGCAVSVGALSRRRGIFPQNQELGR